MALENELPKNTLVLELPSDPSKYYYTFKNKDNFDIIVKYHETGENEEKAIEIYNFIHKKIKNNPDYYKKVYYIKRYSFDQIKNRNFKFYGNSYVSKYFKYNDFIKPHKTSKNGVRSGEPSGRRKNKILKNIKELSRELDKIQDFVYNNKRYYKRIESKLNYTSSYNIKIVSGYRCKEYQKDVNPKVHASRHVYHAAADIKFSGGGKKEKLILFITVLLMADQGIIPKGWIQGYPDSTDTHVHYDFGSRDSIIQQKTIDELDAIFGINPLYKFAYDTIRQAVRQEANVKKEMGPKFNVVSDEFRRSIKKRTKSDRVLAQMQKQGKDIGDYITPKDAQDLISKKSQEDRDKHIAQEKKWKAALDNDRDYPDRRVKMVRSKFEFTKMIDNKSFKF